MPGSVPLDLPAEDDDCHRRSPLSPTWRTVLRPRHATASVQPVAVSSRRSPLPAHPPLGIVADLASNSWADTALDPQAYGRPQLHTPKTPRFGNFPRVLLSHCTVFGLPPTSSLF